MKTPNRIEQKFIVLSPEKNAFIEHADSSLYERLDKTYDGFIGHELVSCHEFDSDWESWEVHPNGDEVVLLLSGEVTFVFELEPSNSFHTLNEPGQYIVVPKGIWHTAKTKCKSKILFITPGEGTQHK